MPSLDLARTALLLDFDGTLVDIAPHPDAVHVCPPLRETLAALHAASGGALAIISGRTVHDVESRLSLPGLVIAGVHGAERRYADGNFVRLNADADALARLERELRAELTQLSRQFPGVMLESKGIAFALHYRHAPEAENAVLTAADGLARRYADHVRLQAGKMVVELKPRGASKGDVVHTLMTEPPFMGRTVMFAGDDLTDESAFDAVNALDGWSVKVGTGPSQARWRVPDPAALRAWLAALAAAAKRGAA
ncbi:trehalose-phosphatase [Ralstonia sp. 21MJYT02-11]|uniref:Trehalose 6-phosphate phosphatase n=2 Tax=Ralstonia soli TaxID=2953896 RepID=A0ABT1AMZ3_9RALS|nr:trehalose-phosphatase [Ralstonia soli]